MVGSNSRTHLSISRGTLLVYSDPRLNHRRAGNTVSIARRVTQCSQFGECGVRKKLTAKALKSRPVSRTIP